MSPSTGRTAASEMAVQMQQWAVEDDVTAPSASAAFVANECVGGYPICIRLLISLDLSVTRVQLTSDNIKNLAGALETGLQLITSIDRLRSAQDRILWGHD